MDTMDNTAYIEPQKLHFRLTGGIGNKEYPIDLRSSAELLVLFQSIIDKSYCVLSGKKRLSSKGQSDCQILIKNLHVGSLESEMILLTSFVLPLAGLSNPKTIWDYSCMALDYFKRLVSALQNKDSVHTNMESHGDNSPNILILSVNGDVHTYPPEIAEIVKQSEPLYKDISQAMNRGNFSSFHVGQTNNDLNFEINQSEQSLFCKNNIISKESQSFVVDIIDFNKENSRGKLRVLLGEMASCQFPFSVVGDQSPLIYINAMQSPQVTINALVETTNSVSPKIVRLHITSLSEA